MHRLPRAIGADVVAAACLIDRSAGEADVGVPLVALAQYKVPAYPADALPPELAAIPGDQAGQPGARNDRRSWQRSLRHFAASKRRWRRYGERFTQRCFTEIERPKSDRRAQRAASYAKRFAAKEACAKALGTGISWGVYWRDMGVVNLPSGKPTMRLTNGAAQGAGPSCPAGHDHIST